MMKPQNIYSQLPKTLPEELFEKILSGKNFKLERIISKGHATDEGCWLDQKQDEWVLLLKGSAGILIQGEKNIITLNPGDYVLIPAHVKHRVEWTDKNNETLWLALHFSKEL